MSYTVEKKRGFPIANDPEVTVIHMGDIIESSPNAGSWLERQYKKAHSDDSGKLGSITVADIIKQREEDRLSVKKLFKK